MNEGADDPAVWARIAPLLDQALDLEPGEREHWLRDLAATQPEMTAALRQLLAERDTLDTNGFLSNSPLLSGDAEMFSGLADLLRRRASVESGDWLQNPPASDLVPTRELDGVAAGRVFGPYRLIREIGQGGMSSVWLAERADGQLKREVALKLPYLGPKRMRLAERFQLERDILATLTHTNIARIYDAGVNEAGQPYLAMEFVQGTSLLRYCDEKSLGLRERLELFKQVLTAVQFAHAHLVIHRDLKPSNILVTAEGRVVLLDFGIAKLLSNEPEHEAQLTELAGRPLTPDYASPEQIAMKPLGTASDIYSLGVVLCELLTGRRPYRLKRDSRGALEEAILTDDAVRPSQLAPGEADASARATTPKKLAAALKGDLDTIVLKALKKNSVDRYASVDAFLHDIDNHLHNIPVSARPDTGWYRFGRFVVRHKLPVGAVAVAFLAVVGGGAASIWQARTAAAERDRAVTLASRNDAISQFTDQLITEAAASEKPVTMAEMLARSEQIAIADTSDNNDNRAAIFAVLARHQQGLGDFKKAVELLDRSLQLVQHSHDQALRSQFVCDRALSLAQIGQVDAAVQAISEELKKLDSDSMNAANCLFNRARILSENLDPAGALRDATLALERFRQTGKTALAGGEGLYLGNLAYAYFMNGDTATANGYYEQAMQRYVESGHGRSSDAITIRNDWALVLSGSGNPRRALDLYTETLAIVMERDRNGDPPSYVNINRGGALEQLGRFTDARDVYQSVCDAADRAGNSLDKIYCLLSLASIAQKMKEAKAAEGYLDQAERMIRAGASTGSNLALLKIAMVRGKLLVDAGQFDKADEQFKTLLAHKAANAPTMEAELGEVEVALGRGDAKTALENAQAALAIATKLQGSLPYSYRTGLALLSLSRAQQKAGDTAQARATLVKAENHLANTADENHPALVQARRLLKEAA